MSRWARRGAPCICRVEPSTLARQRPPELAARGSNEHTTGTTRRTPSSSHHNPPVAVDLADDALHPSIHPSIVTHVSVLFVLLTGHWPWSPCCTEACSCPWLEARMTLPRLLRGPPPTAVGLHVRVQRPATLLNPRSGGLQHMPIITLPKPEQLLPYFHLPASLDPATRSSSSSPPTLTWHWHGCRFRSKLFFYQCFSHCF